MSKFTQALIGAAEITGGAILTATGVGAPLGAMLLSAGIGTLISGLGTLFSKGPAKGYATAERNPTAPWKYAYGQARVGGTVVYVNTWPRQASSGFFWIPLPIPTSSGGTDQMIDLVVVLAAHSIESVDAVLFDMQRVAIDTTAVVRTAQSGTGAMASGPYPGAGTSYTPVQQSVNIAQIQRANGVVTVTLNANIPPLIEGDQARISQDSGSDLADQFLVGTFQVEQIISQVVGSPGSIVFTYLSGGPNCTISGKGVVNTLWADYGRTVYFEPMLGGQSIGQSFQGMIFGTPLGGDMGDIVTPDHTGGVAGEDTPNPWTGNCSLLGKSAVFLRIQYSSKYYPAGLPQISFLVHGKNDILDPRTSPPSRGYTANAALCTADFLALATANGGFGQVYGTQIPYANLIAAANACDEQVPLAYSLASPPLTENAYECNGQFELTMKRGEILQNLLTSCAGRITFTAGQFIIWPGAWIGNSFAIGSNPGGGVIPLGEFGAIAAGPIRWRPSSAGRELYNGCKGTYISRSNKWSATDFPPYCQDEDHGYGPGGLTPAGSSAYDYDASLEADGGDRRWLDIQLPFTTSPSMAQRIAKIELLRRRTPAVSLTRGVGTLALNLTGYQIATLDLLLATIPILSWSAKQLEVVATRLLTQDGQGTQAPVLVVEIDVQGTDPKIYDWSTLEELSPAGYQQPAIPGVGSFEFFATETVPGVDVPYPWKPGFVSPLVGDALYPGPVVGSANEGPSTFGLQVRYGTDNSGNPVTYLDVSGTIPPNQLSAGGPPQITVVVGTSGSLAPGTYVVAASAIDTAAPPRNSQLSTAQTVTIPSGPSNGSIAVSIQWPPDASSGEVYLGENGPEDGYYFQGSVSGTTFTITEFDQSTPGAPDPSFDHLAAAWTKGVHIGSWAQQVQAVTMDTVTIAGAGMTSNQWAGRVLSLLGKLDSTQALIVLNMPVASNTASSGTPQEFTLTIGPNSNSNQLPDLTTLLEVGDLVVMLFNSVFTATSASASDIANPYYPSGDNGVEAGHQIMVLTGPDAGDVQTIGSVSVDGSGHYTIYEIAGQWKTQPNNGDVFIVVEAGWGPEQHSQPFSSFTRTGISGVVASPQITNLAGQTWVVIVRTENSDSDNGLDMFAMVRPIYDFGAQGTRTITTSQTQLSSDRIILIDASAGPVTYSLLPFSETPNQSMFVQKIDSSSNVAEVLCHSGDTLNGASDWTTSTQYGRIIFWIPEA